jgi:predicted neuraminidase
MRSRGIGRICRADAPDGGRSWLPAEPTDLPNPNAGIDAVKMRDGRIALVYNPTRRGRSPLSLAVSDDGGGTWRKVLDLDAEEGREFSYPAIIESRDGRLLITYTWKRLRVAYAVVAPGELKR